MMYGAVRKFSQNFMLVACKKANYNLNLAETSLLESINKQEATQTCMVIKRPINDEISGSFNRTCVILSLTLCRLSNSLVLL